MNSVQFI